LSIFTQLSEQIQPPLKPEIESGYLFSFARSNGGQCNLVREHSAEVIDLAKIFS
jgi:hypothetical protein